MAEGFNATQREIEILELRKEVTRLRTENSALANRALASVSQVEVRTATVTDEMVERAWAAIVGNDVADLCSNISIIRADLRTGLEAVAVAQASRNTGTYLGYRNDAGEEMHCANAFCPHQDKCIKGCISRKAVAMPSAQLGGPDAGK